MFDRFRRFAPATCAIQAMWSGSACSGDTWTPTAHAPWRTNNGPVQVANGQGLLGVLKPGVVVATNPYTAATEKIVADLGYVIGLPIPPVTLYDKGAAATAPRYVAVSSWAFASSLTWDQAVPHLSAEQRTSLIPFASAMMPFETWIGAQDRQNGGNVLVDGNSPADHAIGAWIDYAWGLDFTWNGNLVLPAGVAPMFPPVGLADTTIMHQVVDRIMVMDAVQIEGVVNRIPVEFLPRAVADNIIRNLLTGRATLAALVP